MADKLEWCLGCAQWIRPAKGASGDLRCPSDDSSSTIHELIDRASTSRLVESPWECFHCVAIARRWARVGKTCASAAAVAGGGGVAAAFLVSDPSLTPAQWLSILLLLQLLLLGTWVCAWQTGRRLQMGGPIVTLFFPFMALCQVLQTVYSIVAFPDLRVPAQSSTWWYLVADGVGWAVMAALVRELFFSEVLEQATLPAPENIDTRKPDERRRGARRHR